MSTPRVQLLMPSIPGSASGIEAILVNGVKAAVVDKTVSIIIPVGTEKENGIAVTEDGTMSVSSINVNKLVQTEGETLVLNGGSSVT